MALSKNILKALKGRKACLISNHGQIAFEENLPKAFELAEEVENISLQYITSLKLGKPKILSLKEMKKVLEKAVLMQASALAISGKVYTPFYRQAHYRIFVDGYKDQGLPAWDVAYEDVTEASEEK